MALVLWPSGTIRIAEQNITPVNPANFVHRVPQTGTVQVLTTGYGSWAGNTVLAQTINDNPYDAFFAEISAPENVVEMPLERPTITTDNAIAINSVSGNLYTLASGPTGLKAGVYVRSGNKLFLVLSSTGGANPQISLWPYDPLTTSDTIDEADTVRVRSRGQTTLTRTGRSTYGPYDFLWEQAID